MNLKITQTSVAFAVAAVILGTLNLRAAASSTTPPTFNKDVAPILYKNCVGCHRPGEVAPMSLLTYRDARPWAKSIRDVVLKRQMPVWLADPSHGEFANDPRLSRNEIDTIARWVQQGAPEGDPTHLPPAPALTEGWTIGQPDVVLSMTEAFTVPADGEVPYKYFVVPTNFTEDRYVQTAEIRQGDRSVVHHVIISVREPGKGAPPQAGELQVNRRSGRGGEEQFVGGGRSSDGMLIGWAPGMSPLRLAPGTAKLIKAGSALIFQMHYTTTGQEAKDRTSVGLVFSREPVAKRVVTAGAFNTGFVIPAGADNHEVKSNFALKQDVHIISFMPHMHVRGKSFEYRAVLPDGSSKIVLSVPRYDFNWQLVYFLKEPLAMPKGSRLECTAHFDNSAGNQYNPDPTKAVRWGDQTWEEMMIGWFDYTIDSQDLRLQTASR